LSKLEKPVFSSFIGLLPTAMVMFAIILVLHVLAMHQGGTDAGLWQKDHCFGRFLRGMIIVLTSKTLSEIFKFVAKMKNNH